MKYLVSLILSLIVSFATAQEKEKSLLWKIEGNGINTSYVFGTLHMLQQSDFILKEKVKKAFNSTEVMALEIDMADPEFLKEVMQFSYLKEDEELKSYMDEKEYKLLDEYLQKNAGVGMAQFKKAKPFLLMSTMVSTFIGKQMASYELSLISMAKESKKEVEGLETFASQVAIFDSKSYEKQIDELVEMIDNKEEMMDLFQKMVDLYKAEDIAGLYDYMDEYLGDDPKMQKKLLDDRNHNWIGEIGKFSKARSMFYAVGAGHLGGKQGLIQLLKDKGYTVTPVLE